jgi:excisionase family DNA binding protein
MAKSKKGNLDHLYKFQLLTVDEVAFILKRSKFTVYDLVKTGKLSCVKDGPKLIKFRFSDVERYIESNLVSSKDLDSDPMTEYIKGRGSSKSKD